jgi:predicted RNA-binding protein with PUA domain
LAKNNTSGYKGVYWDKNIRKWKAALRLNGVKIFLGYFDTPEEAGVVYNNYVEQHHGEFYRDTRKKG